MGMCPVVGLLGHVVVLFPFFFKGISILSSVVALSVYIPTNSARGFPFLHALFRAYSLFSIPCPDFFIDSHSDQCQVIYHCSFDLHFS